MQCIQVDLLCVQECAADRTTMSDSVYMLQSELTTSPDHKKPAFPTIASTNDNELSENPGPCSVNDVTISNIKGQ